MFPIELTNYPQWVVWRYATINGKLTKQPYNARNAQLASSSDPNSWTDYNSALKAMDTKTFSGVGFVLSETDPYTFIDLDSPEGDEAIAAKHSAIAQSMNSYSEISPSGKGLHIIIKAKVPGGRRRNKIEIYSSHRFMTMTGNTYQNLPIAEQQYYAELLWKELDANKGCISSLQIEEQPEKYSDEEIYLSASQADNGEKFQKLWKGDYKEFYTSQSEADFALINILGFYSRNLKQIKRMFRLSELGKRDKAKRDNYIDPMIIRSFDNQPPLIPMEQLLITTANKLAAEDAAKDREAALQDSFKGPLFVKVSENDWTVPPGLLGDIAQFIYHSAPRPVKEIALGGAIALMAGICGRAYNVSGTGLNQYVLILAKTGTGKEAAASGIDKLMQKIKLNVPAASEFVGPADIASGQALIKYLNGHPSFVSIVGEFGLALQQMCSPMATPSQKSLRRTLLSLYNKSGQHDIQAGMIYSNKEENIGNLKSPAFSLLGESTPETFYESMDESVISEGLMPRFTCIEYTGERPSLNEHHLSYVPDEKTVNKLTELSAQCLMLSHHQRVIDIKMNEEAEVLARDFDKRCDACINTADQEVSRQLWNRGHIKALKLAGLIAIGLNPYEPIVDYEALNWAILLVRRDIDNILKQFETGKAGKDFSEVNQLNEMSALIADYIRRPYLGLEKYKVEPLMHTDRVMPLSYLQRRLMQKSAFKHDRIGANSSISRAVKVLCDEGSLAELKAMDIYKRYGKTAKCYLVIDPARFIG